MIRKFEYGATCINVVDGDTVDLRVDLGFGFQFTDRYRLAGINAPERGTPGAKTATQWLIDQILNKPVDVRTYKDKKEKYGRYLADLFPVMGEYSFNQQMIDLKLAVPYGPF